MSILIFMRANDESATKSRRLLSSWENKRANASQNPMTARAPAWIKLNNATRQFEVVEERVRVVQRIFNLTLDGVGQNKIAETLNMEGVPVFGRGKQWHRTYVAKILQGESVIGNMTPCRTEYKDGGRVRVPLRTIEGYYPPIIDKSTYDRVQIMHHLTVAPLRGRHASGKVHNIFGGMAKCPLCESTMTRVSKGNSSRAGKPKLVCTKAKTGAGCRYHTVPYEKAEEAFIEGASELLGSAPVGKDDPKIDATIFATEAKISGAEEALSNLLDALQLGPSESLMSRIRDIENELETVRKEYTDLLEYKFLSSSPLVYHKVDDLRAILETEELDRTLVNALMRQMFSSIVINYLDGTLDFQWAHGGQHSLVFGWPDAVIS
jgi:hypothetical protein